MYSILIVYATWTGATRTIAEAIAAELQGPETRADVIRASRVKDLTPYQAIVVMAPIHMGQLPGEIKRFIGSRRGILAKLPLAYGIVCLAVTDDTEENRAAASGYADKMRAIAPELQPATEVKLFGGAVLSDTPEYKRIFPLFRGPVKALAEKPDHRDWEEIRSWAKLILPKLIADSLA
jgi:menaquinone-dependent protoporphyrinogen oxidase